MVGDTLNDKYLIGKVIGQGGFGITYIGLDKILYRKVAIKEYFPQNIAYRFTQTSSTMTLAKSKVSENYTVGKEKFIEEARSMSKLSGYPGTPEIHDYFELNNTAYIVMEYLSGDSLDQYLLKHAPLTFEDSVRILNPVFNIIEKLHSMNKLHRDISPDNMRFNRDGKLCLLDFGASREFKQQQDQTMSIMIKQGYTSPEQYTGEGKQGPHSDIYSLGAILYQMVTGLRPKDALQRLITDKLEDPQDLNPELKNEESNLILKMLSVDSANRIKDINDLRQEIQRATGITEYVEEKKEKEEFKNILFAEKSEEKKIIVDENKTNYNIEKNRGLDKKKIGIIGLASLIVLAIIISVFSKKDSDTGKSNVAVNKTSESEKIKIFSGKDEKDSQKENIDIEILKRIEELENSKETKGVTGKYEGKAIGFKGDVVAKVEMEAGKIKDIKVEAKDETPTIGGQAVKDMAKEMVEGQSVNVDIVAGATISSKALLDAVNSALKEAKVDPASLENKEVKKDKVELNQEANVVVVGACGEGLTSAIVAAQAGKSVIVVEKTPGMGGNTNRATGGMNAAETHYQKEQGITDSAKVFAEDTMKGAIIKIIQSL